MKWTENTDGAHALHDARGLVAGCWRGVVLGEDGEPMDVWFVGKWTDDTRREWKRVGYAKTLRRAKEAATCPSR